jgi:hypothetical protein
MAYYSRRRSAKVMPILVMRIKANFWFFMVCEGENHRKRFIRRDILSNERKLVRSSAPFS